MKKLLIALLAGFSLSMWAQPFELDPIAVTRVALMPDRVLLEWSGQLPPYKVQKSYNLKTWVDISYHLYKYTFEPPAETVPTFYRVRTIRDTLPPAVPQILTAVAEGCKSAEIAWTGPDCIFPADGCGDTLGGMGLFQYKLYRDGHFIKSVPIPFRYTVDYAAIVPGAIYTYSVSAMDLAGNESARSSPVLVVIPSCPDEFNGFIDLAWDANAPEDEVVDYVVVYGRDINDMFMTKHVGLALTARIGDLTKGVAYYFAVLAVDRDGLKSDSSNIISYVP